MLSMCTATYIPLTNGGFVLTHSRDEKTTRTAAQFPRTYVHNGQELFYPKDPQGQGTWIASNANITVCLLNGAFTSHLSQPPYRHSRGLVPLHVFDYESIDDFLREYDPTGLEPFTLLLAQAGGLSGRRMVELRWNGRRLFMKDKDAERPHIWSSATLYTPDIIEQRESWFHDWLHQYPQPTAEAVRHFHQTAGRGDLQNSIRMNRNNALMTLSLTSVVHQNEAVTMRYEDFIQHQVSQITLNQPDYATV